MTSSQQDTFAGECITGASARRWYLVSDLGLAIHFGQLVL